MYTIPGGNITTVDRFKRLYEVNELLEEGKTNQEIVDATGMALTTVKRNIKYLAELKRIDITPDEVAKHRSEVYLELTEASQEAKDGFLESKKNDDAKDARRYFMSWMEALKMMADIYGLMNTKVGSLTQVNTQINDPVINSGNMSAKDRHKLEEDYIKRCEQQIKENA